MPLEGLGPIIVGIVIGIVIGWLISEATLRFGSKAQEAGSSAQKSRLKTKDQEIEDLQTELESMRDEMSSLRKKLIHKPVVIKKNKTAGESKKLKVCPACHKAVDAEDVVCPYCGSAVRAQG